MYRYIAILLLFPVLLTCNEPKREKPPKFSDIEVEYRGHKWNVVWMKHSKECHCEDGEE